MKKLLSVATMVSLLMAVLLDKDEVDTDPVVVGPIKQTFGGHRVLLVAVLIAAGGGGAMTYFFTDPPLLKWVFSMTVAGLVLASAFLVRGIDWAEENRVNAATLIVGLAIAIMVLGVQLGFDQARSDASREFLEANALRDAFSAEDMSFSDFRGQRLIDLSAGDRTALDIRFDGSSFDRFRMQGSDLSGSSFVGTSMDGGVDLRDAPNGMRVNLTDTTMRSVDFTNAELAYVSFQGADLSGATFDGFTCTHCDFTDAVLTGVTASAVGDLAGSLFDRNATVALGIRVADFGGIELGGDSGGVTVDATRSLANLDLSRTTFSNATMTGVDFTGADLTSVNLAGADLTGAILTGVTLDRIVIDDNTRLVDVVVDGRVLSGGDVFAALVSPEADKILVADLSDDPLLLEGGQWQLGGSTIVELVLAPGKSYQLWANGSTIESGSFAGADLGRSEFIGADLGTTDWGDANIDGVRFDGDTDMLMVTSLAETNVADEVNGDLVFYSSIETDLPFGFDPPSSWYDVDSPASFELKNNLILSGLDLSTDQFVELINGGQYRIFQGRDASFRNRSFYSANLYLAEFVSSDLRGAQFDRSNLIGADLTGALLDTVPDDLSVKFPCTQHAGLAKSQFCGVTYDGSTNWPEGYKPPEDAINLDEDISGADLGKASIGELGSAANLTAPGASFVEATMVGSNFRASNFVGADFTKVSAQRSKLDGSDLRGANFSCGLFAFASLRAADLRGVDFDGADLEGVDLTGATISPNALGSAVVTSSTILPVEYVGSVGSDRNVCD